MTQVFRALPRLAVRDCEPKKRAPMWGRHTNLSQQSGELFAMAQDRIAGMTWAQVAEKHGVAGSGKATPGSMARGRVLNSSRLMAKLTPRECAALDGTK